MTGPASRRRFAAHRWLRTRLLRAAGLTARVAELIELDEFIFTDGDLRHRLLALEHRFGDAARVQLDGAHRVIIARNDVVDAIGRAVRVDDRHHRNAELLRLVDRDLLVTDVDDEQRIRQPPPSP